MSDAAERAAEFWMELGFRPTKRARIYSQYHGLTNEERGILQLRERYEDMCREKQRLKQEWKIEHSKWVQRNWNAYSQYKEDYRKKYDEALHQAAVYLKQFKIPRDMYEQRLTQQTKVFFERNNAGFLSFYARFMANEPKKPKEYYNLKKQIKDLAMSSPEIF